MERRKFTDPRAGFNLIAISIILTVAALIYTSFLPGSNQGGDLQKSQRSIKKLEAVEEATKAFMLKNMRRPCPADGQYDVNSQYFGIEAATPVDSGPCTGGTPAAPMGDAATGNVVGGTIPTKSLGLPDDYAFDEWGRRFTYVVDRRAANFYTASSAPTSCYGLMDSIKYNGTTPGITIENTTGGTVIDTTMYAYISHGPDGHGAFPAQGSTVAKRINSGSTDADELTNAGVNSAFVYSTSNFTNVKIRKEPTATFGDIVYYSDQHKNDCCIGTMCNMGFAFGSRTTATPISQVAVGDINGDGIPDLVLFYDYCCIPYVYVVFGTRLGFPNPLLPAALNGTNGFKLTGFDSSKYSGIGAVADINNDGYADIIVSASSGAATPGYVYVIYGGPGPKSGGSWPASTTVTANWLGNGGPTAFNGFRLDLGNLVNTPPHIAVGDVNGDGFPDIVVGNGYGNGTAGGGVNSGTVNVVFGGGGPTMKDGTTAWAKTQTITSNHLSDGINGFEIDGESAGDMLGFSIAVGDFNGDHYADILAGAPSRVVAAESPGDGSAYLIYGGTGPQSGGSWAGPYAPTAAWLGNGGATAVNGIRFDEAADAYACCPHVRPSDVGYVSAMGDINGDGYADIVTGSTNGNAYVVLGGPTRKSLATWADVLTLDTASGQLLNGGTDGYVLGGVYNSGLNSTLTLGDINQDGYADFLIGWQNANSLKGLVYVLFGGPTRLDGSAWVATQTPSSLANGTNGFEVDETTIGCTNQFNGVLGGSPLSVGDVNGDGINDIIMPEQCLTSPYGATYVLYGHPKGYVWPSKINTSMIK